MCFLMTDDVMSQESPNSLSKFVISSARISRALETGIITDGAANIAERQFTLLKIALGYLEKFGPIKINFRGSMLYVFHG